jgi:hypothetical protein
VSITAIILAGSGTPGAATATPPGNASILTIVVDPIVSVGNLRGITIQYIPPGTGTFMGVYVEIEAPDQSALAGTPLDGSKTLASGGGLTGIKQPYSFGPLAFSDTSGTVRVMIPEPDGTLLPMGCRARLRSYSAAITNDVAGSPTQTFTIPALIGDGSATPWCANPTFTADDPVYSTDQGHSVITIRIYMMPPVDVRFKGAVYSILNSEGGLIVQSSVAPDPVFDLAFPAPTWRQAACLLYACGSDGTHINPIIPLLTPSSVVLIGTAAPTSTAISSAVATSVTQNHDGPNGEQNWQISQVSWTDASAGDKGRPTPISQPRVQPPVPRTDPNAYQSWLTFQATDASGNPAPVEQGGVEVLVAMAGYTGETHLTSNIQDYGYQPVGSTYTYAQLRIYVGNKTATGWDDPLNSTLQNCWAGAAYSRLNFGDAPDGALPATRLDPTTLSGAIQKHSTTKKLILVTSAEFHQDPTTGALIIDAVDATKLTQLSAQFSNVGGVQTIGTLDAALLRSGLLQIGGGTNKVSLAKFFDISSTPVLMGFIGDDSAGTGYVGSWFKRCGVGGPDPLHPQFYADTSGNVFANSITISVAGSGFTISISPTDGILATRGNSKVKIGTVSAGAIAIENAVTGAFCHVNEDSVSVEQSGSSLTCILQHDQIIAQDSGTTSTIVKANGITTYDGNATAGKGVAPIYASVFLPSQASSISATALQVGGSRAPAGRYRVRLTASVNSAGSGGTTFAIHWTDRNGAKTATSGLLAHGSGAYAQLLDLEIRTDGSADIAYSSSYSSTGALDVDITMERLA